MVNEPARYAVAVGHVRGEQVMLQPLFGEDETVVKRDLLNSARAYHKSSQPPTKSIGAGIESCLYRESCV